MGALHGQWTLRLFSKSKVGEAIVGNDRFALRMLPGMFTEWLSNEQIDSEIRSVVVLREAEGAAFERKAVMLQQDFSKT